MKIMYLAKRNPRFESQEAFRTRWRQHGVLAMSLPTWQDNRRYVHADALPSSVTVPDHEYDGVGVMWSSPGEVLRPSTPTPQQQETSRLLLEDEMAAFDGPVLPRAILVDEHVVKPGGVSDVTAYLFWETPGNAVNCAQDLARITGPCEPERIVLNTATDRAISDARKHNYNAVIEVAVEDAGDVPAIVSACSAKPDLVVVTREAVLWNHGPTPETPDR